jgi:hypothetical protein
MAFYTRRIVSDIFVGPLDGQAQSALSASYSATASALASGATASLAETASFAVTASFVLSASYATTASFVESSSFARSASFATSASVALSASFATSASNALSASFATSASFALSSSYALSASFATSASSAVSASYALSSSYALSASFATSASVSVTASHAVTASYLNNRVYDREIHVSNVSGNDSGSGTLLQPVKTITRAFALVTGNGTKIIIHPGTYQESPTITMPNVSISSVAPEQGGITFVSGSFTIANNGTSIRVHGIAANRFIISGSGGVYLDNVSVYTQFAKTGSSYMEVADSLIQPTQGVLLNGGTNVFQGGNITGLSQTGTSTVTVVKSALSLTATTVNAGTFATTDTPIYSITSGSAALTSAAGTIVQLFNSQVATLTGIPERVNIGGFFGYSDISFNRNNSTLGTQLGLTADFQNIRGTLIGTASLASTASLAVTASHALTASFVLNATSASLAQTASFVRNAQTASYVATSSYADNFVVNGDLMVNGTASFKQVNFLSSSIVYSSGSTKFGDSMDDTHQVTGSLLVTGSIVADSITVLSASIGNVSGSISNAVTASYALTASYLDVNATASYALTASYVNSSSYALTASYLDALATASYALTASLSSTASNALTASYLDIYATASYALTASYLSGSVNIETGSLLTTASFTEWTGSTSSSFAGTASYATTASYVESSSYAAFALTASYISGSVTVDTGSLVTTASFNEYTSSLATTGSNQFQADQIITGSLVIGTWRLKESGSNLAVEKWDGVTWIQSGYFEI